MTKPAADNGNGKPKKGHEPLARSSAIEEMCWGDAGLLLSIPNAGLGNAAIAAVATDEQMERFGDMWAAMAITEPGSGSDSGSITAPRRSSTATSGSSTARRSSSPAPTAATCVVVWATVDKKAGKSGIKSFIVEKDRPGFKLEHLEHKLGIRASDTGTFVLDDCRIPKNNLLGSAEVKQAHRGLQGRHEDLRQHQAHGRGHGHGHRPGRPRFHQGENRGKRHHARLREKPEQLSSASKRSST